LTTRDDVCFRAAASAEHGYWGHAGKAPNNKMIWEEAAISHRRFSMANPCRSLFAYNIISIATNVTAHGRPTPRWTLLPLRALMNSILPSKQIVCPSCGTFNPSDASVCERCGAKQDVPPDRTSFDSGIHFIISFCIIFVGAAGFLSKYPPGKIKTTKFGYYHTTQGDVLIWGMLLLILGVLYLFFAVALKIRERFFR
jgi:ribosomal protein L40E